MAKEVRVSGEVSSSHEGSWIVRLNGEYEGREAVLPSDVLERGGYKPRPGAPVQCNVIRQGDILEVRRIHLMQLR